MRMMANSGNDRVVDLFELRRRGSAVGLDIAAGDVSIWGAELAMAQLGSARLRLLLGGERGWSLTGGRTDRAKRNELRGRALARSLQTLVAAAETKQARLALAQSMILAPGLAGVVGDCAPTTGGLGLAPPDRLGFVHCAENEADLRMLADWFESHWAAAAPGDSGLMEGLAALARADPARTPYLLALDNLFADMEAAGADRIVDAATGIRDTAIWSKLYRFQKDGVVGIIDKLNRFGGCILADSVGLGKTFEALAVIKYHELRNARVLVLAPKRLRENWTLWTANDRRNSLAKDRFAFDVLNHTDLSRSRGRSGEIDLEHVTWSNYDLVVIDESHNFRNRPTHATSGGESRYDRLMREVVKAGIKTRVLMLSATPVNNRLADLRNQIAFATEGDDRALAGHGIPNVAATIRQAQSQFKRWQALPDDRRSAARLLEMLGFDYVRLLDLLTIARSRRHIERYYGTDETGAFPEKLPPDNIHAATDTDGRFPPISEVNGEIRRLLLAAYAPLRYVRLDRVESYQRRYDQQVRGGEGVFRQLDREESLIALMRVNLLKRMESSVHAFALTVERQLGEVDALLARIETHRAGDGDVEEPDVTELADDDPLFDELGVGRRIRVLLSDCDLVKWRADLHEDRARLARLLAEARAVGPQRDAKLARLRQLVDDKAAGPYNPGNAKLLVFTAFADTAAYLFAQLAEARPGRVALVTGTGANRTTLPGGRTDLQSILTAFAPRSKGRPADLAAEGEIDLLIATDCISEGQNLQDCDCVVNYDIHWNPVRIVQRFGRVDRLGSPNAAVKLINFWPNLDLDAYIGLQRSVSGKMTLLDISATGEENLIEAEAGDRMNDLEYRRTQLEQLQSRAVDLDDLSSGVSITDLTLNDLRLDLANLDPAERDALTALPIGAYAPVFATDDLPPGALFVLRAETEEALAAIPDGDPLRPHVLIYVGADEGVVLPPSQAKRALDLLRLAAATPADRQARAWAVFDDQTDGGATMGEWQRLLAAAVRGVTGRATERAVESLFSTGAPDGVGGAAGLDDWEVVSWLAVLPEDG